MERNEQSHHDDDVDQCHPPEELGDVVRIIGRLDLHDSLQKEIIWIMIIAIGVLQTHNFCKMF